MGYQDQLERTRRWLKRLENASSHSSNDINNPMPPEKHEEYEDYLYSFFQNCWHVKDWILADTGAPQRLQEAVRRVNEQGKILPLMLCSGVANGSKHLRQGRDRKRHAKTVGEILIEIDPESNSETTYAYKVIDDDGNSYNAIEVARKALKEWETIIMDNSGSGALAVIFLV